MPSYIEHKLVNGRWRWTTLSTGGSVDDDSLAEVKLDISNTPSDGYFLQYKDSTDKLTWTDTYTTGVTAGTVTASKALIVDGNKDLTGLNDVTIAGTLTVNGTTTTVNSTTLTVDDKNIELGSVDTPSDTTADGGGITLKGASDKTILWTNSTDSWDFNQDIKTSGTVTDSKGKLRRIPKNDETTDYTLVAADAGKYIEFTPGDASQTLTVPDSVFDTGDAITIVNNSGNNLAIAKGTNMYYAADGTNANRTLAGRGMATLLFIADDTCYISGAGLS